MYGGCCGLQTDIIPTDELFGTETICTVDVKLLYISHIYFS